VAAAATSVKHIFGALLVLLGVRVFRERYVRLRKLAWVAVRPSVVRSRSAAPSRLNAVVGRATIARGHWHPRTVNHDHTQASSMAVELQDTQRRVCKAPSVAG
jgi:hypothetical protein